MFYYWLIPIIIVAVVAIGLFAYTGKRKNKAPAVPEGQSTEAVKRGRFINR